MTTRPARPPHSEDFGPLGDVTLERGNILEHGYNTQDLVALGADAPDPAILRRIRRFADEMADRGVQVLFSHAPLNALCVTSTAADTAAYADAVRQGLDLPVLVDYPFALMDAGYFYDSNNHRNSEGAALYTDALLDSLLPLLAQG